MSEHIWQIGKVQIVISSGSKLLTRVLAALIVVSMAAMGALGWVNKTVAERNDALRRQASALEYENTVLQQKTDNMSTVRGMLDVAESELNMVAPDTILFQMQ